MKSSEYLKWVGDLDGDGQPDYLIDLDRQGGYAIQLFLSSLAKPGEIVGLAGRFSYFPIEAAGC